MIHSGELHKISKGRSQERHFFLFDHQLVYCKKVNLDGCNFAAVDCITLYRTPLEASSVIKGEWI